jgi:hypothetical protein
LALHEQCVSFAGELSGRTLLTQFALIARALLGEKRPQIIVGPR